MKALELKVPPLVLVELTAVFMWAVANPVPTSNAVHGAAFYLSVGLLLAGVICAALGVIAFRQAGTTVDPRVPEQSAHLVTTGIYQVSRNPMYLGFLLMLCAWAVLLSSLLSAAFIVVFVLYMNRFQIIPEERFMQEKFGAVYAQYKTQVRRWL